LGSVSGYLGVRQASGEIGPANRNVAGAYVVTFSPDNFGVPDDFEIFHIAIKGPGGNFEVWIDETFYSTTDRGDINEYDPKWAMPVRRGQSVTFHWSLATGTAPQVWMFLRRPGQEIR